MKPVTKHVSCGCYNHNKSQQRFGLLGLLSQLRWLLLFNLLAGGLEQESLSLLGIILARLTGLEGPGLTERAAASGAVMEGDGECISCCFSWQTRA